MIYWASLANAEEVVGATSIKMETGREVGAKEVRHAGAPERSVGRGIFGRGREELLGRYHGRTWRRGEFVHVLESGDKLTLQIFDCKEDGDYCDTDAKETIETSLVIGAEGNAGKRGSAVIRAMDESKMCKTKMVKLKRGLNRRECIRLFRSSYRRGIERI